MGIFSRKSVKDYLPVSNTKGIHIRPATNICLLAKEYPETNVMFSLRNRNASGININELLALSAGYHDELEIQIDGPKAKQLLKKVNKLFADFDQYKGENSWDISSLDPKRRQCGYGRLLDERC